MRFGLPTDPITTFQHSEDSPKFAGTEFSEVRAREIAIWHTKNVHLGDVPPVMRLPTLLSLYIRVRHGIGGYHEVHEAWDDLGSGGMGLAMLLQWGLDSAQSVSAQDSTDPVFVGAGDIAGCGAACTGDKLLPNSSTTSSTLHPLQQRSSPPETTRTTKAPYLSTIPATALNLLPTPTGASSRLSPSPAQATTSTRRLAPPGYFDYFSATPSAPVPNTPDNPGLTPGRGYYSYDLGSWHIISLNSNCSFVDGGVAGNGCAAGSDQVTWLKKILQPTRTRARLPIGTIHSSARDRRAGAR